MHRTTTITAFLPHGIYSDASWLRKAELREITGYDESYLYEVSNLSVFKRSEALLERIVNFGNRIETENRHLLSKLTIGDMAALILQIRRMVFGEYIYSIISCPSCNTEMSLELKINHLLQPPLDEPRDFYDIKVENFMLKLRPVTNGDISQMRENICQENLTKRIIRSCIINSTPELIEEIDDNLLEKISSNLAELDPQADLILDLVCPNCKYIFQVPFFPEDFFLREFDARQQQFEMEVHWLAFNYHWSEDSILSLTMNKRKRYVELINKSLSGDNIL